MPARGRRLGEDADRLGVAALREVVVAGAAVDVGPGGGIDHDLGPVAVESARRSPPVSSRSNAARVQAIGPAGPVYGASPRAVDEGTPQSPVRPGDRDAHQPAAGQPADRRRDPYWRS